MQLDPADKRILRHLQQDVTIKLDALADAVGLSRNACWRRVKRLEEEGVISARVALLDPTRVNLGLSVFIAIRTDRHEADWLRQFAAAVRDVPEIVGVYRTSGDIDYLIKVRVPDVAAYDALYRRLIAKVALSNVSASFVMEEIKETTELPLGYA